jgi:hypothetical protein
MSHFESKNRRVNNIEGSHRFFSWEKSVNIYSSKRVKRYTPAPPPPFSPPFHIVSFVPFLCPSPIPCAPLYTTPLSLAYLSIIQHARSKLSTCMLITPAIYNLGLFLFHFIASAPALSLPLFNYALIYFSQHCLIYRLSDSTVSEDIGIDPGLLRL